MVAYLVAPHVKRAPSAKKLIAFLGPDEEAVAAAKERGEVDGPTDKSPEGVRRWMEERLFKPAKRKAWETLQTVDNKPMEMEGNGDKTE